MCLFYLENKIDASVLRKICVDLCYITLEILLICINMERVSFLCLCTNFVNFLVL
jgi:hypothetical protein